MPAGLGVNRPAMRTASSANQRKNSAPYLTSPMLSASTLPISSVIRVAMSSARSVIFSKTERRISPRSRGGVAAHSACTAQAASSAAIASSGVRVGDGDQDLVVGGVENVERRLAFAFLTTDPQTGGY